MPRKRIPYSQKLAALRRLESGFDAKRFDRKPGFYPKTAKARAERKKLGDKVARAFKRIAPFVHRPHKLVRVRNAENLKALKKFVGMSGFKNLRAVPVPTMRAGKLKVSFDKKHRVTLRDGQGKWKFFPFPHAPRDGQDAIDMMEALMETLPGGLYILASRHHFLIPTVADRDSLASELRKFVFAYRASPEFLRLLVGVKWVSGSYERAQEIQRGLRSEREREKSERKRIKNERIARELASMDRAFKAGKISARARATGRR